MQWKSEREQLESLLMADELESARATTLNAHYTAPVIIRAMYMTLQRLGFTHEAVIGSRPQAASHRAFANS